MKLPAAKLSHIEASGFLQPRRWCTWRRTPPLDQQARRLLAPIDERVKDHPQERPIVNGLPRPSTIEPEQMFHHRVCPCTGLSEKSTPFFSP